MTRFGLLVVSGVVVAVLGIALLLWGFARQSAPKLENDNLTPVVDPSVLNIHANGEYGFTVQYPASAVVEDAPLLPWRANDVHQGSLIVRFTTKDGEVRIGASAEEGAISGCLTATPSEIKGTDQALNGDTWTVFTFDELGTEDERRVTSYRIVHDDTCFALETYEPYRPGGDVAPTERVEFIVRSFDFAR